MPLQVKCTNPDCDGVFQVGDEMAGQTAVCPRCGAEVEVGGDAIVGKTGEAAPSTGQSCPNCGAALGAGQTFCPHCGTDVRTGEAARPAASGRKSKLPLLIGGIVAGLLIVGGGIFLATRMLGGEEPAPSEPKAAVEKPPAEPAKPKPAPKVEEVKVEAQESEEEAPKAPVPPKLVAALKEREKQLRQEAEEYVDRLQEVLAKTSKAEPEGAVEAWAELYAFCRENDLKAEAEECAYAVSGLGSVPTEVNEALGRTAEAEGVAVTPEQKQFLDSLAPVVRIVNENPDLKDHLARVGTAEPEEIPWGRKVEFRPEPGLRKVEIYRSGNLDRAVQSFSVQAYAGMAAEIELRSPLAATALPLEEFQRLSTVGRQTEQTEDITVRTGPEGGISAVQIQKLRVKRTPDSPVKVWPTRRRNNLAVIGRISTGNPFDYAGEHVIAGVSEQPAVFEPNMQAQTLTMRGGTYFLLRIEPKPPLWGALATAQADLADEWERRQLLRRLQTLHQENLRMEAEGEIEGPWEAVYRTQRAIQPFRQSLQARKDQFRDAARLAPHLDRVRVLGLPRREERLYMNWPRFRRALARRLEGSGEAIIGLLGALAGQSGGTFALEDPEEAPYAPPPVKLGESARLHAELKVLPMMPARLVLNRFRANWDKIGPEMRPVALAALRHVTDDRVVSYLGSLTEKTEDMSLMQEAFLSLGTIGTPRAMKYADIPTISPEERTAAMVAKVVAGEMEAIRKVPAFLEQTDPEQRNRWLELVSSVDTPGAFLALRAVVRQEDPSQARSLLAEALVRRGGTTSVAELHRLMQKTDSLFAAKLDRLSREQLGALLRPLGEALLEGTASPQVLGLLSRAGSEPALAYLRSAAVQNGDAAAMRLLARRGTPEDIEALISASSNVDMQMLERIREFWLEQGPSEAAMQWRGRVDSDKGRAFFEHLLKNHRNREIRMAAAVTLRDVGHPPEPAALGRLASEDAAELGQAVGVSAAAPDSFQGVDGQAFVPQNLAFDQPVAFYALGLLLQRGDAAATAEIRKLAESYKDGRLKAAALRVLAHLGGPGELAELRQKAAQRSDTYADAEQLAEELEDRLAAMQALGAVGDAEFLPRAAGFLNEAPPDAESMESEVSDYSTLSNWWVLSLRTGACRCIAAVCRVQGPAELTGDEDLQESLQERLVALVQNPGPRDGGLGQQHSELRAEVVRTFGRVASPTERANRMLLARLGRSLFRKEGDAQPSGGFQRRRQRAAPRGQEASASLLGEALLDAAAHMVMREKFAAGVGATLRKLAESDAYGEAWKDLLVRMASHPSPGYFRLLQDNRDLVPADTLKQIVLKARGQPAASGAGYALVVASVMREAPMAAPVVAEAGAGAGARPAGRGTGGQAGGSGGIAELEAMNVPNWLKDIIKEKTGRDLGGGTAGGGPAPRGAGAARRTTEWSYSLEDLSREAARWRQKQKWADILLENPESALGQALSEQDLVERSPFGPLVACRYAKRVPSAAEDMIDQLQQALIAKVTSRTQPTGRPRGVPGWAPQQTEAKTTPLSVQRAAVIALRRLGGDPAQQALYTALVGPILEAGGPGVSPPSGVPYVARALGTTGREDLLQQALQAGDRAYFRAAPAVVQSAALTGLGYLPAEDEPIQLLNGLMQRAASPALRSAAAEAISIAVSRAKGSGSSGEQE